MVHYWVYHIRWFRLAITILKMLRFHCQLGCLPSFRGWAKIESNTNAKFTDQTNDLSTQMQIWYCITWCNIYKNGVHTAKWVWHHNNYILANDVIVGNVDPLIYIVGVVDQEQRGCKPRYKGFTPWTYIYIPLKWKLECGFGFAWWWPVWPPPRQSHSNWGNTCKYAETSYNYIIIFIYIYICMCLHRIGFPYFLPYFEGPVKGRKRPGDLWSIPGIPGVLSAEALWFTLQ